jgi:23S rRNA-intervening sequence protein
MSYRNLEIWKLSCGLVVEIHKMSLTRLLKFEMFEEGTQIRRSMKSIRSNIVEGYGRRRYKSMGLKAKYENEHLTPALSPFCYRKTRRGSNAPSVFLNHATCHSWPQKRTVSRYAYSEMLFETGSLVDEPLFKNLSKRLDEPGRKLNLFTQAVEANHRTGASKVIEHQASGIQHPASRPRHPASSHQP